MEEIPVDAHLGGVHVNCVLVIFFISFIALYDFETLLILELVLDAY